MLSSQAKASNAINGSNADSSNAMERSVRREDERGLVPEKTVLEEKVRR